MRYLLLENAVILVCALAGLFWGCDYLKPKKPLYASMIVMGEACIALGRLFQCVRLLTGDSLTEHFQVGMLGMAGAFSFYFTSNFGQIDSLVDDGGPAFSRYRLLALAGPFCTLLLYLPILSSEAGLSFKIGCAFVSVIIAASSYFHVKHLFIPDVDYGVVRCSSEAQMKVFYY